MAFSWNCKDQAKTSEVQRLAHLLLSTSNNWQGVLDVPGLRVLHMRQAGGACDAYVLKQGAGVVVGKLFDRQTDMDCVPTDPSFDDKESEQLIKSQGRRLVDRCWGHYIAFLRTPGGEMRYVLRDPTGGLPCYLMMTAGIDVILSDIEDCVRLNFSRLSVDWGHVTAFFQHTRLVTRSTGFKEVTQLLAGECVAIQDHAGMTGKNKSFYWSPASICEADMIENVDEARTALRDIVRHCVNGWASCYDSIVHELSGGLDSSIIADCLAGASNHPDVLCFHYFTEMSEGDERFYAQVVARSTGFELIESEVRVSERPLESLLNPAKVVSPAMIGFLPDSEILKRRLVTERHAGAVFSGHGGDQVFLETRSKTIAAEYAHRHGIRPQLLRIIRENSRLSHQSFWSVWGTVVHHGLLRRSFDPYSVYRSVPSVLGENARALLDPQAYTHPWVENACELPPAKMEQILNVVDCQPFYQEPCPHAEQVHPLISQPIIELCLRIPTYLLTHGGRARGLVRESFESDLPVQISQRRSKGGTTSYFTRILVENAKFLREFLLDGALVEEGMLDRRELERLLSEGELVLGNGQRSILCSLAAEKWAGNWAGIEQPTAA